MVDFKGKTFRVIEQDETVVSTILYICECVEDGKIQHITHDEKLRLISLGHKFI